MQHYSEMANLPLAVLQQFPPLSKYFHFRCVAADLGSPALLQIAPTWVSQASPQNWKAMWSSTSQAACMGTGQSTSTAVESLDTVECIRQSFTFHLVQQAVTYLSQGHQCPTPPDSSHQRRELRNSTVINNGYLSPWAYPFPSIFNFMFRLPAALVH